MAEKLSYPSIPVPKEDLKSLNETVLTLKRAVEMLTGQGKGDAYASHMFVQPNTPEAMHQGDLWLCSTMSATTLNVWMGETWVKLMDVNMSLPTSTGGVEPTQSDVDLNLGMFSRRKQR